MKMLTHNKYCTYRFENTETKRYYRLVLSQDLFGEWIVTKIWGGIGTASGRIIHIRCICREEAIKLIDGQFKIRKKRGYTLCERP